MKTCPECGYALAEFDTSCPKCKRVSDTDLKVSAAPEPAAPITPKPEPAAKLAEPEKKPADDKLDIESDEESDENTGDSSRAQFKPSPKVLIPVAVGIVALVGGFLALNSRPQGPAVLPPPEVDVPALIGLDYKAIGKKLGEPVKSYSTGEDEAATTWKLTNYTLMVTHGVKAPKVTQFLLEPTKDGITVRELENAATVVENDSKYTVQPVEVSGEPGSYAGLRIIPTDTTVKASAPEPGATPGAEPAATTAPAATAAPAAAPAPGATTAPSATTDPAPKPGPTEVIKPTMPD